MNRLVSKIVGRMAGKFKRQRLFEDLHALSLQGMNFGRGGDFKTSGEMYVLNYVKTRITGQGQIVLFDVGSNVGNYALEMSNVFAGSDFCIHCFEPSAITYQKLLANLKGFDKIISNNSALSETEMTADLFSDSELSGLASLYHRKLDHLGIAMDKKEKVQLTTIDNYCPVHHIDKITFLKLDVEGYELNVLRGANEMLSRKAINFIQFEFGGCNIDSRTYFRDFFYLLNDDFIIYRIVADGLFPISGYKETDEIFTTVNYLAERR